MKRTIGLFLLLILLTSCQGVYPFCEQVTGTGSVVDKRYTESYTTINTIPHQQCSGTGKNRSCYTYYTTDVERHPATYSLILNRNGKIYERYVSMAEYYSFKINDWVTFPICKSDLGD